MTKASFIAGLKDLSERMGRDEELSDTELTLVDQLCLWFDGWKKGRASVLRNKKYA